MKDNEFKDHTFHNHESANALFSSSAKISEANEPLDDETKDFLFGWLASKANPEKARELTLIKIREAMEENINEVLKDSSINSDSFMLGFMVKCTIANCVKTFKEDLALPQLSGLNKADYDKLVDDVAIEMLNKYFET